MKELYSIKEIAQLYQLPKSTLRYWEEKGLIHPSRNQANSYRIYDLKELIDIGDIAFYRNLNVPIKVLKKYRDMNYQQLSNMVTAAEASVLKQMDELNAIKKGLQERKEKLALINSLPSLNYQREQPDMEKMITYMYDDTHHVPTFQNDPYSFGVHIDVSKEEQHLFVTEALVVPASLESSSLVWQRPATASVDYRMALIKMNTSTPLGTDDVAQHIATLRGMGFETKSVVGRYLCTFNEAERYDYFKAWFEVTPINE